MNWGIQLEWHKLAYNWKNTLAFPQLTQELANCLSLLALLSIKLSTFYDQSKSKSVATTIFFSISLVENWITTIQYWISFFLMPSVRSFVVSLKIHWIFSQLGLNVCVDTIFDELDEIKFFAKFCLHFIKCRFNQISFFRMKFRFFSILRKFIDFFLVFY